ncbi:MAG: hypothetical protein ACRCX7_11305 [Cetobacterium sp.]
MSVKLRYAECCGNCGHATGWEEEHTDCGLHDITTYDCQVCNDFKRID